MSVKILFLNKKNSFTYEILERFEAGLVLTGSEIKSIRNGGCQLKDSYISFRKNEAFLQKAHISPYEKTRIDSHKPERIRKILLHHHELSKIQGALQKKGLTCVPTKLYLKNRRAKIEIALARRKKPWDKRQDAKKKRQKKEMSRQLKR